MTERAKYVFEVKEFADRTPWIMLVPFSEEVSATKGGFIGFDLALGTSLNEAEELARRLNDAIQSVSYTRLEDDEGNRGNGGGDPWQHRLGKAV